MSHGWLKLLLISFLLVSGSECCLKRLKEIKRKIEEKLGFATPPKYQPTMLERVPSPSSSFPNYANNKISELFIELEEDEHGSYKVINLERLPPILSQMLTKNESVNITSFTSESEASDFAEMENITAEAQIQLNGTDPFDLVYVTESDDEKSIQGDSPGEEANSTTTAVETTTETAALATKEDVVEEEILSDEDVVVRAEWGGECKAVDWKRCNKLTRILAPYNLANLTKIDPLKVRWMDIDCSVEPILCLCNGWTVNRCQIMCMSKCNREMLIIWDVFVLFEGPCPLSQIPRKSHEPNPCEPKTKDAARHEFG